MALGWEALAVEAKTAPTDVPALRVPEPRGAISQRAGLDESLSDMRALICAPEWDWDCTWALATVWCESSGNPLAYNPAGHVGLWQVSLIHRWTREELEDAELNTRAAHELYLRQGRGAWPGCP
jgi:hypothetical protein